MTSINWQCEHQSYFIELIPKFCMSVCEMTSENRIWRWMGACLSLQRKEERWWEIENERFWPAKNHNKNVNKEISMVIHRFIS